MVHDGEWGEYRGGSPEVHDHFHSFESAELQVVKNAPDSVVSSANFRSLTEGSLDVQSLVYREKSSGERT